MSDTLFSPLSIQKYAAILVSSVCSSYYPGTSVRICEVDSAGFDLVLEASHELNDSSFVLLQEEVRREKNRAEMKLYSMMLRVLKTYVQKENKILGPSDGLPDSALVDICEVNGYCGIISGAEEQGSVDVGYVSFVGYTSTKEQSGWRWHIRGASFVDKKASKHIGVLQELWQRPAALILQEQEMLSASLLLPRGVELKRRFLSWLTQDEGAWIEDLSQDVAKVASDEELMDRMFRKHKTLRDLQLDYVCERFRTRRPIQYRLPWGRESCHTAVIRYLFTRRERYVGDLPQLLERIGLPYSITIMAPNRSAFLALEKAILREVPAGLSIGYEQLSIPFSAIVLKGHHGDGRLIPLASWIVDLERKVPMVELLALSVERWLGLLFELSGTIPPFFTKNRIVFLMVDNAAPTQGLSLLEEQLTAKGVVCEIRPCHASNIGKKRADLTIQGVPYVAVVGKKDSFLLYVGDSKKGQECRFEDFATFFEKLPPRQ